MFGFDGSGKHNGHDAEFAMAMLRKSRLERAEQEGPERPEAPRGDDAVERFPEFADAVRRRLSMGARAYQNEPANEKPLTMLCDELATELEDLAGWGALLWMRVQSMRAKLEAVESEEP